MKQAKTLITLILISAMAFMLCGCKAEEKSDLWADAIHTKDAELGEGAKTVVIEVKAEDKAVSSQFIPMPKWLAMLLLKISFSKAHLAVWDFTSIPSTEWLPIMTKI